jgi:hypothetical protein
MVETLAIAALVAAWAGVIANAAAAGFVYLQIRRMKDQINQDKLQNQYLLCLEIWKEYNNMFSDRQSLLKQPVLLEEMRHKYGDSIDAIVDSEEYKMLRRVASVYGMAASLIKSGGIRADDILNYISVPPKLWDDHLPLIKYIRDGYYPNLFVGWEELDAASRHLWKPRASDGRPPLIEEKVRIQGDEKSTSRATHR